MNIQFSELILPLVTAIIGGLVASAITYKFSLKRDQEERRREKIIAHLIDAYKNLESVAGREKQTPEMKRKMESAIADIYLFSTSSTIKEATKFTEEVASRGGDITDLLKSLRQDLRCELKLETNDVELKFFRMSDAEGP